MRFNKLDEDCEIVELMSDELYKISEVEESLLQRE